MTHQVKLHSSFPTFIDAEQRRGNIKGNPASGKWIRITRKTDHSTNLHLLKSVASIR